MGKACADLFDGLECSILGNPNEDVCGIAYRSDAVKPGDAFFCIVGFTTDGHSFAQDAIERGARVLVVERKLYLADASGVTEVVVSDSRKAMAHAAAQFYGHPSRSLSLVGITGTNGKTTTTYLVEHIARVCGKKTGIIGTVGTSIAGMHEKTTHTTPESPDLQQLFARMRDAHCDVVAMEVSSHALDLLRTWKTQFAVTAFTNLTQDHLDYHHTFEAYFEAKARLFSSDYPAKRVICIDDTWGTELLKRCSAAGDMVITTGFSPSAQIHPLEVNYGSASTTLTLAVRASRFEFTYPLVGKFNVENVMSAFGIGMQLGFAPEAIAAALRDATPVPGRLERVRAENDGGISVYVDYAHTPDALKKAILALDALKATEDARLIVVFGCGGDRDATKRPLMGKMALLADYAIVTSDNPRSENPDAIIEDIVSGMGAGAAGAGAAENAGAAGAGTGGVAAAGAGTGGVDAAGVSVATDSRAAGSAGAAENAGAAGAAESARRFEIEVDRARAIAKAIEYAHAGDAILIAGKGHEDYQLIGDEVRPFDDRLVAKDALENHFGKAK